MSTGEPHRPQEEDNPMLKKTSIGFFSPRPFRWERVGAVVVWLVVASATEAAAAESDPGVVNFEMHCATCHAQNGSGDTPVGKSVKIPDLRSPEVQSQPDAQLVEIIANGKGAMPPFKSSLSKDQIDALVKHVHQLAKTK